MALNSSKIKAPKGAGNTQELIPIGMHPARVAQVLDLGVQPRQPWKGKKKPPVNQLWVTYELTNQFMKDDKGEDELDRPRWISEQMNLFSLSQDNAASTKRINGLDPTGSLEGDWSQVGGLPCLVQVTHSKDGKYANIGAVLPPMDGMDTPEMVNEVKVFDLDSPDLDVYNDLPDFLQELMRNNLEFKGSVLERMLNGEDINTARQGKAMEEATPADDGYQVDDEQTMDAPY